jgi:hypothetical protein
VAYPSDHARIAHVLWIAHTWSFCGMSTDDQKLSAIIHGEARPGPA